MRNSRDVPATHINLSDCADRVDDLEAFFERHGEWFLGDTIVIAEGPPSCACVVFIRPPENHHRQQM